MSLDSLEPGIREHVERIQNAGWETWASCEHEMYVVVVLPGYADVPRLLESMESLGYPHARVTFGGYASRPGHILAQVFLGGHYEGDGRPIDFVLLKVPSSDPPLHFILEVKRYGHDVKPGGVDKYGRTQDSYDEYFYNEHTCPTNWTSQIEAIVFDGDFDPHGVAHFVRRVQSDLCPGEADDQDFMEMFPELLKEPLGLE